MDSGWCSNGKQDEVNYVLCVRLESSLKLNELSLVSYYGVYVAHCSSLTEHKGFSMSSESLTLEFTEKQHQHSQAYAPILIVWHFINMTPAQIRVIKLSSWSNKQDRGIRGSMRGHEEEILRGTRLNRDTSWHITMRQLCGNVWTCCEYCAEMVHHQVLSSGHFL